MRTRTRSPGVASTLGRVTIQPALTGADAEAVDAFGSALAPARSVAVAFSGGVDSSVTAALATRLLGADAVVCVLGVSPSLAASERRSAHRTAGSLGVRLVEVETHELGSEEYVANRGDRCYFCKRELYTRAFAEALTATGSEVLVNGDTADDAVAGDRPGRRAAHELGVCSPLAEAGIGKARVRALARALGLEVWDKPSAPCLASRVAVDHPVTVEVLSRVERAEAALHDLGLRELRVRHVGPAARIELGRDELRRVRADGLGDRVVELVRQAGYGRVELSQAALDRA